MLFACCMVCHGELAALKPAPRHLTAFYLSIAAGGALGGLLVAVAAPLVLDRYLELHLGLWACCALAVVLGRLLPRPAPAGETRGYGQYGALDVLMVAGLLVLGGALWMAANPPLLRARVVHRSRDFYGVLAVSAYRPTDPQTGALRLHHGGVTHGHQFLAPERRSLPTSYYGPDSGVGLALNALDAQLSGRGRRVGVVGLGAGTLAAYGRAGDVFRFYELNPSVAKLARDPFTYLRDSRATCEVVLGDARISLEREPPGDFDLLVLDAFSGDAIPVHLLTAEAFELYRRHLAPGGIIAVHISNHYLDLQPVLAAQAAHGKWHAVLLGNRKGDPTTGIEAADWVLLSDDAGRLDHARRAGGVPPRAMQRLRLWTDEYTSLLPIVK
jgi:SAM-dependent methyltransferase